MLTSKFRQTVKNLGVFDSGIKFNEQINSVVWTSFYQLHLLSKVKGFLSYPDLEKAINAFIGSKLDYCNTLYVSVSQSVYTRLGDACTKCRCSSQTLTLVLCTLHWLPVCFLIDFIIVTFVFQSLTDLAPPYLYKILVLHEQSKALRSSNQLLLQVPRSRCKHWGERAFSVAAPRLWNKLSPDICICVLINHLIYHIN